MTGVEGKVVAITGAGTGIGAATARLLAERGARVVVGGRTREPLDQVADAITAAGGQALVQPVDVADREQFTDFVAAAQSAFGRLDVLVSNAGVATVAPVAALKVDDWQRMIDVNLMGLLWGVAAALPVFQEQHAGQFVNVLSTSGLKIVPGQAVYAATKNAARTFAEALRQEVGSEIRVTSVSPGLIATDFALKSVDESGRAAATEWRDAVGIPPSAIAQAIAFAIGQPAEVDVSEIVVRPTAQA